MMGQVFPLLQYFVGMFIIVATYDPHRTQVRRRRGVLFHVERHPGRAAPQCADQVRQKVGRYGVNDAQAQHALQRVTALVRNRLHPLGLLQRAPGLRHDLLARLGEEHAALAALEEPDAEFLLQVFHRGRKTWLAHEAALGGVAEMARFRHRHHVFEFGKRHRVRLL